MSKVFKIVYTGIFMVCNTIVFMALLFLMSYCGLRWGGAFLPPTILAVTLWTLLPICYLTNKWIGERFFKNSLFTIGNRNERFFCDAYHAQNNLSKQIPYPKDLIEDMSLFFGSMFAKDKQKREKCTIKLRRKKESKTQTLEAKIGKLILRDYLITKSIIGTSLIGAFVFSAWIQSDIVFITTDSVEINALTLSLFACFCVLFSLFVAMLNTRSQTNRLIKEYKSSKI